MGCARFPCRAAKGALTRWRDKPLDLVQAFEQERGWLTGLAYRMLGSVADAEDIVQEAWLRWSQTEHDAVRSPRGYLTAVVTRLCIDHLRLARVKRETYVGTWLPEPLAEDMASPSAQAELADSLSMAFLLLLERLSPPERAAYLLREIFGCGYGEVAASLEKNEAACRQLVSRAKERLAQPQPRFQADPAEQQRLMGAFLGAIAGADYAGLVEVLAQDVVLHADHGGKALSVRRNIYSADRVARLFLGLQKKARLTLSDLRPAMVNGALGLVIHENGQPSTAMHFDYQEGRIATIYQVRNPDKLKHLE